ncbi:MAG TPA: histidine phosphatase family protein [Acidimicrobiales bacterium]|nr:histidine phosphatase family protein [Acidimicrobiales bacterium]
MTRLYLVRHGEAAGGWGDDFDPGLSERGRSQAAAMTTGLTPVVGRLPVVVSPLRRTRETAGFLESLWGVPATVDPRVGELPSPSLDLGERLTWLGQILTSPWDDWPADVQSWRAAIPGTLLSISEDTVVVTHYVFIGQAVGDPGYRPDYCSVTVVEHDGAPGSLRVVERGAQRSTVVR